MLGYSFLPWLSSLAIILLREKKFVALLNCVAAVFVLFLFGTLPIGMQSMIVAFPGYTCNQLLI